MNSLRSIVRLFAGLVSAAALALLGGCLKERLVWSPDGHEAAVLTGDGLRFCTPDGTLTALAVSEARLAVWLPDSQHLLVVRERSLATWTEVSALLAPTGRSEAMAAGDLLLARLREGARWSDLRPQHAKQVELALLYLRDTRGEELRSRLSPDEAQALAPLTAKLQEIFLARRQGTGVELGAPLFADVQNSITAIRLAPGGKAAAITLELPEGDRFALAALMLEASAAPLSIATDVAAHPDWTPDGRALIYAQAVANQVKGLPQFAVLMRREVFDAAGKPALAERPTELGGLLFQSLGRIRCLADGRIVFNAAELALPLSASDFEPEREQLFVLDPARQATLARLTTRSSSERLPQLLAFFEPSADGRKLLIGGRHGEVCVFTLATGEVQQIQEGDKDQRCLPAWRGPDEFTYLRRNAAALGETPARRVEVVLRRGDQETVLSTNWPDAILKGLSED
ncbi:MAG TPA: hypothetical protein VK163_15100 [Opitutaceae bacterium]|nr:hypothetical protein [Opitutaceae bacterium]